MPQSSRSPAPAPPGRKPMHGVRVITIAEGRVAEDTRIRPRERATVVAREAQRISDAEINGWPPEHMPIVEWTQRLAIAAAILVALWVCLVLFFSLGGA